MNKLPRKPFLVVLTGPPGAGKTTSIELMKRCGFVVMTEIARELIDREQKRGGHVYPWTHLTEFVDSLWRQQERQFHAAQRLAGPVFFDRGIADAIAFMEYHQTVPSDAFIDACRRCRYHLVFDLHPLPEYKRDAQRPYSEDEANALARLNQRAYRSLGYEIVSAPVMPIAARIEFVLMETRKRMRRPQCPLPSIDVSEPLQAVVGQGAVAGVRGGS
ncbi:AAA family ATPase [Sorangium sp. So ce375]|uniref:AAA family ATPase n=1 Tax=Sorangium sp. So ce375 TaxID=3133306 RepID=UPI003F5C1CBF